MPLLQDVYIWQRSWNDAVREAVSKQGSAFNSLVVLKAEVHWSNKGPDVTIVPVDYRSLTVTGKPLGLALRIGGYRGPFLPDGPVTEALSTLAAAMIKEAGTNGAAIRELQIDFDCAESKLEGYATWVRAIRSAVTPVAVNITALPSWLNQDNFRILISEADGYVLQVHSLERPDRLETETVLCDVQAAQRAVKRASKFGKPFRVALPTYGYLLAFDSKGQFLGLSAEGPSPSWPSGSAIRELRSDPKALAALVQFWAKNCPPSLKGIIWYRLPVPGDNLNWRWPTLRAIMDLRSPRDSLRVESRRVESGLIEINLLNDGELDISSRLKVQVRWPADSGTRLLAADGLRGFEVVHQEASTVQFQSKALRLPAGETRVIGWLRFNREREVQVECSRF